MRNELLVAPLDITPILYMEDGTEYDLPPVHLATGGVAVLDVNQALANAPASVASHVSQAGSAALRYQYTSPGHVVASIQMLNTPQSLIFTTAFNGIDTDHAGQHTVEGLWWRRDSGVGGFVSLANMTEAPVSVSIQAIGAQGTREPAVTLNLGAHGTQMLDLDSLVGSLPGLENQTGGLGVQYSGPMNAVMVTGGLVNASEGYSAVMPFWFHEADSSSPIPITYASAGIMTGPADPMMGFPGGTRFSPYFVLRNTTREPLTVSPALNWMTSGGAPVTQNLPPITLGPFSSKQVGMKAILQSQGLHAFSGNLNLAASFTGHAGDLILATGSVDDTGTYVFEVEPQGVGKSNSKQVAYWTVANGFDTMFSLWNPTSDSQDLVMTFYYADGSGSYTLPVHLAGSASTMIDMMMLIESGQPDANGQTIPMSVTAGSAIIQNAAGRKTPVTLVVAGGTFNVTTATCGTTCINCCAYNNFVVLPSNYYCPVGQSMQCSLQGTDCNGGTATFAANWSSNNTAIMTISSSGLVTGVAPGTATITGQTSSFVEVTTGQICAPNPACPTGQLGAGTTDSVTPTIAGPNVVWWFNGQNPSGYATSITLTASPANAGSYTWDIVTGSNKATLTGQSGNTVQVVGTSTMSTTLGDVQITVTVNSITSNYYPITVRGPKTAVAGTITNSSDPSFGYLSILNYTIEDNLNQQLPSGISVGLNENWTTSVVPDYSGTTWRRGNPNGIPISNSQFSDRIQGELSTYIPTPSSPRSPLSATKVDHWGQEWRVGSLSPGVGARVQTDTLQKFVDHALHTNIVTPAP